MYTTYGRPSGPFCLRTARRLKWWWIYTSHVHTFAYTTTGTYSLLHPCTTFGRTLQGNLSTHPQTHEHLRTHSGSPHILPHVTSNASVGASCKRNKALLQMHTWQPVTPESPTFAPLRTVNPGSDLVSTDTIVAAKCAETNRERGVRRSS